MSWGEFKKAVEELGVKDDDKIYGMDVYEPEKKEDLFIKRENDDDKLITIYGGT